MKILRALFISAYLMSALGPVALCGEDSPLLYQKFANKAELQKYASSSDFGGWKDELTLDERQVFYTTRTFTSGLPTTELIFYTKVKDGMIRSFLSIPMQRREFKITADSESIEVTTYDRSSKSWHVALTITPWMLPVR